MKRILVTGANGFVGKHLIKELSEHGIKVMAIGGQLASSDTDVFTAIDLTDPKEVEKINFKGVDGVIHLAGLAVAGSSFNEPLQYINVNMGIEINLFEEALRQHVKPKFLIVSSGTLYSPKAKLPLTENSEVQPSSPYAISKLGQEQLATYYMSRDFECIIARPFNHVGPGQNAGFIVPDLVEQAIKVEQGKSNAIKVGNLSAKRDFTDVRDIVKAYRLLMTKGAPNNIYNVCSGHPLSGEELLRTILNQMNIKVKVQVDPKKLRPVDIPVIYGTYSKLNKATGWRPTIDLQTTIKDIVEDWRSRT